MSGPWTQGWNLVSGCTAISDGCEHCWARAYASRMSARWGRPDNFSQVVLRREWLGQPQRWKETRRVVVSQMGDLFQDAVPDDFIRAAFAAMADAPLHRFRVLTKRSARLAALAPSLPWPPHIWAGVTVETLTNAARLDDLRRVPAVVRFVNAEPLLGDLNGVDLADIHWVVCGAETGPGRRPAAIGWYRSIIHECERQNVRLWIKAGANKPFEVDGREYRDILL